MKKLILASLLTFGSSLFAGSNIGISINAPIANGENIGLNFRADDHRYDNRYKNFDYNRNAYADDYGYYFGYFDRTGYFYNNIYFLFDSKYTYYDRLHHRGFFDSHHPHYREYRYHKNNDWNRVRNYRNDKEPIYGHYYERKSIQQNQNLKQNNQNIKQQNQNLKQNNQKIKQQNQNLKQNNKNNKQYDKNRKDQIIYDNKNQ